MAMALRLAARGMYTTHPNPRVGCVIVKGGRVVGRGYHLKAGEGHAEVNALAEAADEAAGATAYVTLEPCSFQGRTPPCTSALIDAGISRVVAGMVDPNPRVAGAGIRILQDAGMAVTCPLLEPSAIELNKGFVKRNTTGLPWVRLKMAMSMDGKTALANGKSQWITGPGARQDVQRLRAASSALVTGVGTVLNDDPALTVRDPDVEHGKLAMCIPRPIVVLDPELRIPDSAQLMSNPDVVLASLADAANNRRIVPEKLILPDAGNRKIDLKALLAELATRECNEVMFECGATLAGALVSAGLLDELVLYIAPKLMGADAQSLLRLPEIDNMRDLIELDITDVRTVDNDIRVTAMVKQKQKGEL